jgi:hypothetical protein
MFGPVRGIVWGGTMGSGERTAVASITMTVVMGLVLGGCNDEPRFVCTQEGERDLYDKRIAPLLADERPSSCNECHLSGVDLGLFVQDSPCETMACMVHRGIVDLEQPEASIVLGWIERADPASPLVTETMIREEYEGVLEWIRFSAHCGQSQCETTDDPCGEPSSLDCEIPLPEESRSFDDPGDCSERTLEAMFAAKVYPWRGRCFPCHFADAASDLEAPRWIQVGECDAASLATMRDVLARGYANTLDPERSLLLLKPLAESAGGVVHGGHDKISSTDEAAYVDFLAWLQRYATCR